jgi:hypothetical protein
MRLCALAGVAAAALVAVSGASANGDPASDYLLSQSTFLPFDAKIPEAQAEQLNGIVEDAKKRGYTIRVAVISKRFDLGAVPSLWRKPKTYARFLGQELFFVYKGRLLVVMPNGYGVSMGGKPLTSGQRIADRLPAPGEGGRALTVGATRAVQRLAAQSGVRVDIPAASSNSTATRDRIVIAGVAGAFALLIAAGVLLKRRR